MIVGTEKVVTHYHFTGWEDWHLPDGDSRESLAELVAIAADFVKKNHSAGVNDRKRLLVHCKAGIGRTGTTLALINATIAL